MHSTSQGRTVITRKQLRSRARGQRNYVFRFFVTTRSSDPESVRCQYGKDARESRRGCTQPRTSVRKEDEKDRKRGQPGAEAEANSEPNPSSGRGLLGASTTLTVRSQCSTGDSAETAHSTSGSVCAPLGALEHTGFPLKHTCACSHTGSGHDCCSSVTCLRIQGFYSGGCDACLEPRLALP